MISFFITGPGLFTSGSARLGSFPPLDGREMLWIFFQLDLDGTHHRYFNNLDRSIFLYILKLKITNLRQK